jgi:hypothetical protein
MRVVAPVLASHTNTSTKPLVSSETRFDAFEWYATKRPSAETAGRALL